MVSLTRGWDTGEEQIANAPDDAFDLSPVSQQPYLDTLAKWQPLMGNGARHGSQHNQDNEEFDD